MLQQMAAHDGMRAIYELNKCIMFGLIVLFNFCEGDNTEPIGSLNPG